MPTRQKIKALLIYLAVFCVLYFGSDLVTPLLERSAVFHGVMVAGGVLSLPIFALLLRIENDPRPFPPGARYPRVVMGVFFFAVGSGLIFWGLGFWFSWARVIGCLLGGAAAAAALLMVTLVLRADRANDRAKKAREANAR